MIRRALLSLVILAILPSIIAGFVAQVLAMSTVAGWKMSMDFCDWVTGD